MTAGELDGYWPSPWPGEDGGPQRRQAPTGGWTLAGRAGEVTGRECFGANMLVWRDHGELFLQGNTFGPDTTAWVERIDPRTLAPIVRSPDLPGGPFWAGGVAAHRDGHLYVTYGRWCHKLDPVSLEPVASVSLPRNRPYNSLVILPDGVLVMKDFPGATPFHAPAPDEHASQLVAVDPDRMAVLATHDLAEGSTARLSARPEPDGSATVVVVGDEHLHQIRWDGRTLAPAAPARRYVTMPGQTFGWDPVLVDGSAWFLDDGDGSTAFGPSFRGKGANVAPLHLVRVDLDDPTRPPDLAEVCGRAGGLVANPPAIDPVRRIAVAYDSGNGVIAGFRYHDAGTPLQALWRRDQDHAAHLLVDTEAGLLLTGDYDHDRGTDRAVALDLETGDVVWSVDTGSPVQSVLFPAPGPADDVYTVSFTTVARLARE